MDERIRKLEIEIAELKGENNMLRLMNDAVASSINAVGITDLEGKLIYVNDACVKTWGYESEDEMLGRFLPEFWDGDGVFHTIKELQEKGMASGEDTGLKKDGTVFHVQFSATVFTNEEDKPAYMFGSFFDITDRKKAVDALQKKQIELLHAEKLAAIGKLSASIAHEFNNPLYGIQSVIEGIMRNVELDDKYRKLIGLALSECYRVKDLIRDLQDFNRPSTGVKEATDINVLLDGMLTMIKKEYKNAHIAIQKKYAPDLPCVRIVPDQIKQVILNLLTNAKDAISDNSGTVTIITENHVNQFAVRIVDTGDGIAKDNISSIFEPFFTTKSPVKGTGLGLSVSYGIIKGHGGDIQVDSIPGTGTTISILLPVLEESDARTECTAG